jgi:hypothetical protein
LDVPILVSFKCRALAGASAGENKKMAANLGAAHIVNFSLQYACVGICLHVLVRDLVYDASLRA